MNKSIAKAYFQRFTVKNVTYTLKNLPPYREPKYDHIVVGFTDIHHLDFSEIHDTAKLLSHYTPTEKTLTWKFLRFKAATPYPYEGVLLLCDYDLFLYKLIYHIEFYKGRLAFPSDIDKIFGDLSILVSKEAKEEAALKRWRGTQTIYDDSVLKKGDIKKNVKTSQK